MSRPAANPRKKLSSADPSAFTPCFSWKSPDHVSTGGKEIVCEGVRLTDVAARFGTPTYLYSGAAIARAYNELDRGLGALPHTVCFAVKANRNLSLLKHVAKLGSGFDIVSGGELSHLRRIGVPGGRIVFSGVGKTREEIREALRYRARPGNRPGLLLFNIESPAELDVLLEESARHVSSGGAIPSAAIRVNPDVQAGGHPHISTGHHEHKFGLDWMEARRVYLAHRDSKWMRWQGISAHIGSQIVSLDPFRRALRRLAGYVGELRREGIALRYLDFGGGLGVRYTDEQPASRKAYAQMVAEIVRPLGMHLLLEPGRSILAAAGVLLTRVIYTKQNRGKTFVVVDAAMNDLMRPALYGAVHALTRVTRGRKEKRGTEQRADIVGPVCESGDCFLRDWPLGRVEPGEVLAFWTAGAYGMSLASNYNARCRPAEVLVAGQRCRLIRRRETLHDLQRTDVLA
jgi:diaminopimelate decarboxylase